MQVWRSTALCRARSAPGSNHHLNCASGRPGAGTPCAWPGGGGGGAGRPRGVAGRDYCDTGQRPDTTRVVLGRTSHSSHGVKLGGQCVAQHVWMRSRCVRRSSGPTATTCTDCRLCPRSVHDRSSATPRLDGAGETADRHGDAALWIERRWFDPSSSMPPTSSTSNSMGVSRPTSRGTLSRPAGTTRSMSQRRGRASSDNATLNGFDLGFDPDRRLILDADCG